MLVLTRKIQDSIVVGDADDLAYTLKITVLQIRCGEVRLGFEAPTQIVVNRLEVWERLVKHATDRVAIAADRARASAGIRLATPMNGLKLPDPTQIRTH